MAPGGDSPYRERRDRDPERAKERRRERERERDRTRERERASDGHRDSDRERDPDRDRERERRRRHRERNHERGYDTHGREEREERRRRRQSSARPSTRQRSDEGEHAHQDQRSREERRRSRDERRRARAQSSGGRGLSAEALAQMEREERRNARRQSRQARIPREEYVEVPAEKPRKQKKGKKGRVVSGAVLEEGMGRGYTGLGSRGGTDDSLRKEYLYQPAPLPWWKRRRIWMYIAGGVLGLILIIVIAVVVSKNKNKEEADDGPSRSNLDGLDRNSVPLKYQGTDLDPWTWADTSGFNVTFTDDTVGDLPLIGLFTEWDDSKAANKHVPALNKPWGSYDDKPARGVNVGGWLTLEPFIAPSLFNANGVVDEYTLCQRLGGKARETLERHYANFITEMDFKEIADAGMDHIRIPFSYWAVEVYDDDPYVFRTSWRYLLRAIEWARKYGLRVNLDLHGIPGSQNGWNHSGRQGAIGWLNGPDGKEHGKRSLDVHDRLSKFFAQDRYRNIITHYGLANEPKMTELDTDEVLGWTEDAYEIVRKNGVDAIIVFGDGFMGLKKWKGRLRGLKNLALDVHQYVIFNKNQVVYTRKQKLEYACQGWSEQAVESMDTSTGYGPTIFAEWSQADTDCAQHLTNVGWGNRWEGTYDSGLADSVLEPRCPTEDERCSCARSNGDFGSYPEEYKRFLKMFAEAQMHSFEKGWGWWYWTWKTESATQWSYKTGLRAGILPEKAYERDFHCGDIPDFEGLPEYL